MRMIAPLLSLALLAACSQDASNAETVAAPAGTEAPVAAEPAATASPTSPDSDAESMGMSEADHQAMGTSSGDTAAAGTQATASGTIESVDPDAGKIVIAHGAVEALKWPAMTMGFTATPEQIKAVQTGQKVEFEFLSQGAKNTITRITPAE